MLVHRDVILLIDLIPIFLSSIWSFSRKMKKLLGKRENAQLLPKENKGR